MLNNPKILLTFSNSKPHAQSHPRSHRHAPPLRHVRPLIRHGRHSTRSRFEGAEPSPRRCFGTSSTQHRRPRPSIPPAPPTGPTRQIDGDGTKGEGGIDKATNGGTIITSHTQKKKKLLEEQRAKEVILDKSHFVGDDRHLVLSGLISQAAVINKKNHSEFMENAIKVVCGDALHVVFRLLPELGHAGYSFQLDCWFLVESEEGVGSGSVSYVVLMERKEQTDLRGPSIV